MEDKYFFEIGNIPVYICPLCYSDEFAVSVRTFETRIYGTYGDILDSEIDNDEEIPPYICHQCHQETPAIGVIISEDDVVEIPEICLNCDELKFMDDLLKKARWKTEEVNFCKHCNGNVPTRDCPYYLEHVVGQNVEIE